MRQQEQYQKNYEAAIAHFKNERPDISDVDPTLLHLAYNSLWTATCIMHAPWGDDPRQVVGIGTTFVMMSPAKANDAAALLAQSIKEEELC